VPGRCDGCGRAAADARMDEDGWAVRPLPAGFAGAYCLECASALQLLPWTIDCAQCGRKVADEGVAEREGWRFYADALGHLEPFCRECAGATKR
jgi:hypothetical protein